MKRFIPLLIMLAVIIIVIADMVLPGVSPVSEPAQAELEALENEIIELRQVIQMLTRVNDLVRIQDVDDDILVDLRYASSNNFSGKRVYPADVALLRRETALKLARANAQLMEQGFRIKVWDAYRPYHIHQILWNAAGDKRHFFADPRYGSIHNRGAAVDITLVDSEGREIPMPSDFDDFHGGGHRNAVMSPEARENMDLLTAVMVENGFDSLDFEWWHFEDSNWWLYPILDMPLELFDGFNHHID